MMSKIPTEPFTSDLYKQANIDEQFGSQTRITWWQNLQPIFNNNNNYYFLLKIKGLLIIILLEQDED